MVKGGSRITRITRMKAEKSECQHAQARGWADLSRLPSHRRAVGWGGLTIDLLIGIAQLPSPVLRLSSPVSPLTEGRLGMGGLTTDN